MVGLKHKFSRNMIAVLAIASASLAHAQTGTLVLSNTIGSWNWSSSFFSGQGGPFSAQYTPTGGSTTASFITYCTSVDHDFYPGNPFTTDLALEPSQAGWLVDNITTQNDVEQTALQLAIWSVTASGYSAANIATDYASNHDTAVYNDYLADITALGSQTALAYDFNYTGQGQPQIAAYNPGPGGNNGLPSAPGPLAAIPFGLGLVRNLRKRSKSK